MMTQNKSWFARNWGWVVPLGGCLTIIVVFFLFLGTIVFGVGKMMTSSDPYETGLKMAREDRYVLKKLGEPIETDGIMQGSLSYKNNKGDANINLPIKGPKGKARLYIVGTKDDEQWNYSEIYVIIDDTNEQIDLLGFDQQNSVF
ncbi:cytochrome c oxidase assembly factor Coa1 family protein [Aquimarina sp. W85]|uniref:cytochrome c oxidase assembly factor Coa1 family protein n=1 Tax=Aquimarina rhodophyticola TaxID=3342246 RepID=UPI00366D5854